MVHPNRVIPAHRARLEAEPTPAVKVKTKRVRRAAVAKPKAAAK